MRGRLWLAVALSPALMATSCPSYIEMDVERGGAPGEPPTLAFSYQRTPLRGLDSLRVTRCPEAAVQTAAYDLVEHPDLPLVWQVVRETQITPGPEPLRITYGRVPPGYREETAAAPLEPGGCYSFRIVLGDASIAERRLHGVGLVGGERLRLLPDGRMVVGAPEGTLMNRGAMRQLNRAAVGCARGYRRARAPGDSAAVDARRYAVLDTALSCGWLTAAWPDVMQDPASSEHGVLAAMGLAALLAAALLSDGAEPRR